jgi:hypothetical protein
VELQPKEIVVEQLGTEITAELEIVVVVVEEGLAVAVEQVLLEKTARLVQVHYEVEMVVLEEHHLSQALP